MPQRCPVGEFSRQVDKFSVERDFHLNNLINFAYNIFYFLNNYIILQKKENILQKMLHT